MHIAWTSQAFRSRALLLALAVLPCAGCQSPTGTGMATGAGVGAIGGAILGGLTGRPLAGAALGAAAGTAVGGIAGSEAAEQQRRTDVQIAAATAAAQPAVPAPTLPEIVELTRNGTTDDIIIGQIQNSGAVYRLNSNDILYLEREGVRGPVIRALQQTVYRTPRRVIVQPVQPVYVEPAPVVGVSYGWGGRW
jgi:hypothetical protein